MSLSTLLQQSPYLSYSYAYPHKSAYRAFEKPIPLQELWQSEVRDSLFLYFHIPFCEMRCGFCNLFTTVNPAGDIPTAYLKQLKAQAEQTRAALGDAQFARMAVGGGTPTYLTVEQLTQLFEIAGSIFEVDLRAIPISVETSPQTSEPEKLQLLYEYGVDRISIGVQSFIEAEAKAAGRPQRTADVHTALRRIKDSQFPTLNLDLIYGIQDQTVESWLYSLQEALAYTPEEIYLYPLYVRPLTGLGRMGTHDRDLRYELYQAGRDFLQAAGYEQVSMRFFQKPQSGIAADAPYYCCQDDGMVGLGCGARSYTTTIHYSTEYAVSRQGVLAILNEYIQRDPTSFDHIYYGFPLNNDDQRRRYVIKSILRRGGLNLAAYTARFGTGAFEDLPQLQELIDLALASIRDGTLRLTPAGFGWSDVLGPWLYSITAQTLMEAFELR